MKQKTLWSIITIAVVIVFLVVWFKTPADDSNRIIARNGLHWHPVLTIYADGVKQTIPADIGLTGIHQPIHTHEDSDQGIIHLEFGGVVRQDDVRLSNFFRIWDKDIMSAFGTLERMTVNGADNTDYGRYEMRDDDKIELYYATTPADTNNSSTTPSLEENQ